MRLVELLYVIRSGREVCFRTRKAFKNILNEVWGILTGKN